jgi:hypothetical protein
MCITFVYYSREPLVRSRGGSLVTNKYQKINNLLELTISCKIDTKLCLNLRISVLGHRDHIKRSLKVAPIT